MIAVRRYEDVQTFHAQVGGFLSAREAEHNLLIGLASRVGSQTLDPGEALLAAAFREDRPVLAAVRAGFHLVLSDCDDPNAVAPMAAEVRDAMGSLSGVNGPVRVARQFTDAWSSLTGAQARLSMSQRIYLAETTDPPDGVPGAMRTIEGADRDLLIDWVRAFHAEATPGPAMQSPAETVDRRLLEDPDGVVLWEDARDPVAMAAVTGPTPNGIRVGLVYTPPEHRNHGYASALVAALTRRELDRGRRFCFLYTDLANPTSNRIYQRIGYRPVTDVEVHVFDDRGEAE